MPSPGFVNTFAGAPLDRAADRRGDAAWVAARLEDSTSRALALWNGRPLADANGGLSWLPAALAKTLARGEEHIAFLGLDGPAAVFALDLEGEADPVAGPLEGRGAFGELRALAPGLSTAEAAMAGLARSLFDWRRRHRFCANCGQPTRVIEAGWRRQCGACGTEHYPRVDPVAIMLPVRGERCLLGRQAKWPAGRWSTLAGFIEPGESIEEACARELAEEAGVVAVSVRHHSSQPWPWPSQLMIGLIAQIAEGEPRSDGVELEALRWFTRDEARALLAGTVEGASGPPPMAIAHQLIRAWTEGF